VIDVVIIALVHTVASQILTAPVSVRKRVKQASERARDREVHEQQDTGREQQLDGW
jgi:hypothetical protein